MPGDIWQGVSIVRSDYGKATNEAMVFSDGEIASGDVGKFWQTLACYVLREGYGRR